MKCPSCKTVDLTPTKLADGLPAQGCAECGGAAIALLYYREWAERTKNEPKSSQSELAAEEATPHESHSALNCPKCAKLMTKYSISGKTKNRLDLCTSCDEAWLDGREWQLLHALQLSKNIPSIFTEPWQRKVRTEISEARLRERFAKVLGDADMAKADEIRAWIKPHKKRAEILFYLGASD